MGSVAVLGDRDSVYGFAALGLDVYFVEIGEDASPLLKKLCKSDYSIIYITEVAAATAEKVIEKYSFSRTPAIILIPGVTGNTEKGIAAVKKSVEKAVGSDIVFND